MQTVAYVRVSSKAQDVGMQKAAIERAAASRGDVIQHYYAEKRSARTSDREELNNLRNDAKQGLIKKLYIFRLDRLTRTGIRETFEIVEEFQRNGVQIITINDGFSLEGPAAQVILAVLSWAAQQERLVINERIAAARMRMEEEGGRWGRPKRQLPVEKAKEMRDRGMSIRAISVALKVPKSTVARALS